ncbi:MAG: hypothetical protein O3A51_04400, partial [Verrucomicrobia bacterium]|nr:hypothetical protein [Verrucomicrobiota bacterium]
MSDDQLLFDTGAIAEDVAEEDNQDFGADGGCDSDLDLVADGGASHGGGGARNPGEGDAEPPDGPLRRLIDDHFIQYASYVIRDRAIPDLADGLKPVQRRILWSLKEQDDGKFTKVANVVGHCMQYHPHGDAAITDALVVL